jgi:hypothetical protein
MSITIQQFSMLRLPPFARTAVYEQLQYRLQTLALRSGWNLSKPTFVCL